MRTPLARIEKQTQALEERHAKARIKIAELAMSRNPNQLEALLSALGAERKGIELSDDQRNAKAEYLKGLENACKSVGYPSVRGFEKLFNISLAFIILLGRAMPYEELRLAKAAFQAVLEGKEASGSALSALDHANLERQRIRELVALSEEELRQNEQDLLWPPDKTQTIDENPSRASNPTHHLEKNS